MNLKDNTVNKLAKSIMDDVMIDFTTLKEAYLKSDEFKALVTAKIDEILILSDKVNEMYGVVEELPKNSYIVLGKYMFTYNSDLDIFEYRDLEVNAEEHVLSELAFEGRSWNNTKKEYIDHKVSAIVSTLDESVTHANALNIVREQINLVEILHNKNI